MSSTTDIAARWQQLKNSGLNLGAAQGAELDAGYGGRIQAYQNGRIYWHHTVGCFEVHGGILSKYLSLGGHGINPATGQRELGFPKTNETITQDGYRAVSYFEWGAVYWCNGGVSLHGDIYQKYVSLGDVTGKLGYPVSDIVKAGVLNIAYFEHGCICQAQALGAPIVLDFNFPLMGNPAIVAPLDIPGINSIFKIRTHLTEIQKSAVDASGMDIINLIAGNSFFIRKVVTTGAATQLFSLTAHGSIRKDTSLFNLIGYILEGGLTMKTGDSLPDRTLFDVCYITKNNLTQVIAPHCLYTKQDTTKFGAMHATDFHVSRRLESIRKVLHQKGFTEGAQEFINWNDRTRDLIKYANHLHDIGVLDMIIATGDLVDFVFEKNDNRKGGGNFSLFRDILLGRSPYGDKDIFPANANLVQEELRVPIFTTLGNHDYRPNPYEFYADIDAGDTGKIDLLPGGIGDQEISSYTSLNITESEVKALQGGSKSRPNMPTAASFLTADPSAQGYYRKYINANKNFVVRIGINNIVMIDSKWDLGILNASPEDILKVVFKFTSETEKDLLEVNPDSIGFEQTDIDLVKSVLANSNTAGTTILGVHAPIVNAKGNEYPHYFRETEHPTVNKDLMSGYLIRQNSKEFSLLGGLMNMDKPFSDWIRTGSLNFKKQDPENMLDYGTSRGKISELIDLALGHGVSKPIDLILCGHGHKRTEYRFGWNPDGKFFRFYTDFYTENPEKYYSSLYNEGYYMLPTITPKLTKHVHVMIREGASLNQQPAQVNGQGPGAYWTSFWQITVPPYKNSLDKATTPQTWWQQHRPLMLQTAAVCSGGNQRKDPSVNKELPDPDFSGVRMISIENNVITKIRYLLLGEIRKNNFKLSWEPVRQPPIHSTWTTQDFEVGHNRLV